MKKLWMIAGSALVMSACSDNVAEMNPAPAGNNDFVTLAEISASLPATRAYLEDVEFGAGKEVKTFWSSGDCITVWSEQEPERLLLYRLKSGADTPNAVFEVVGNEEGVHGTQFYALYNGSSSASKQITLNSVQNKLNSTCKCNRILINNLFKFFVWREVSKSFTRSIIEFIFNPLNLFVGYFTKVLTLWDILPDKPVGVFIGTTFP